MVVLFSEGEEGALRAPRHRKEGGEAWDRKLFTQSEIKNIPITKGHIALNESQTEGELVGYSE
jgi:hypothetical protein